MAFHYENIPTTSTTTPTYQSKQVLAKSFLININAGAQGASGTAYTVGSLPKEAQVLSVQTVCITTVTGPGPITASTMAVGIGGVVLQTGFNAFSTGASATQATSYMNGIFNNSFPDKDLDVTYTFTHTGGTTPSTGRIYLHVLYVV